MSDHLAKIKATTARMTFDAWYAEPERWNTPEDIRMEFEAWPECEVCEDPNDGYVPSHNCPLNGYVTGAQL